MKNLFFALFVFTASSVFSQTNAGLCTAVKVEANFVDSLIMSPNLTKVDITSAAYKDLFNHYQSTIFKVVDNFLVVDNNVFFDLNKIIAFKRLSRVQAKGDLMEFYFE